MPILLGVAVAATPGCLGPTEITFEVTTDVPCASLNGVGVSVGVLGPDLDTKDLATVSRVCDDTTHSLGKLVVTPAAGASAEVGVRFVTSPQKKSPEQCITDKFVGCIVARRALRFRPHEQLTATVALEGLCLDKPCTPTQTCSGGVCVDARTSSCAGCDGGVEGGASGWKPIASPASVGRFWQSAFMLGPKACFWGGDTENGPKTDAYLYDPTLRVWSDLFPPGATVLTADWIRPAASDGQAILTWGSSAFTLDGAWYDGMTWKATSNPQASQGLSAFAPRNSHLVLVAAKRGFVWGGESANGALADGAVYDPTTNTWTPMPVASGLQARINAAAVVIGDRAVVFSGDCGGACSDGAVLDATKNQWVGAPFTAVPRHVTVAASDGSRALFWGMDDAEAVTSIVAVDAMNPLPQNVGSSQNDANAPSPRHDAAGWYANGKLYVWGGAKTVNSKEVPFDDGAAFDFQTGKWTKLPSGPPARSRHQIVWTGTHAVMFGGQDAAGKHLADAWVFE